MAIVNVRIDERLIHGQVATMWTNRLKATRIMVVNDEASSDDIQKAGLKLAIPARVKLSVLSVKKAVANIKIGKYDGQHVFVIFKNPQDVNRFLGIGERLRS